MLAITIVVALIVLILLFYINFEDIRKKYREAITINT